MNSPEFLEFKVGFEKQDPVGFATFNDKELYKIYLIGKRIRLDRMNDPDPIENGIEGTITHVDDIGQIHVKWDNGRTLAVIPNIDKYTIL